MRILVTGGAGYVGGFAARHLLAHGHDVRVFDDLSAGHRAAVPEGVLAVGDLADGAQLRKELAAHRAEAVMHFAGSTSVGESVREPARYYRNNVANTLELLEAMHDCGVARFVFSSTCAVHGETAEMPLHEESPIAPTNPYAFSKHVIEQLLRDEQRAHGLSFAALRYFNASGGAQDGSHGESHDPETHLIPLAIQTVLGQRGPLQIFGDDYDTPDGTCVRDYVHVDDLARAHALALALLPEPGGSGTGLVYNLGSGTGSSVLEVIESVERITGRSVPHERTERRPGDVPRLVARSDKAHAELGWTPEYTALDPIVASAWAWHEAHPRGYASAR